MSNQIKEKLIDDSTGEPMCMNWPPSRGPEPEWMTCDPDFTFPAPTLVDDPDPTKEWSLDLPSYSAWSYVTDLLEAGPKLSDKLVLCARMKSAEDERKSHERHVADGMVVDSDCEPISFRDHADTLKYLDIPYPHLSKEDAELFVTLDYPLDMAVRVRVVPFTTYHAPREATVPGHYNRSAGSTQKHMTVGWLLWSLARAYEMVYAEHEKYGVWGHSIRDLCFEQLIIDGNRAYVGVGS